MAEPRAVESLAARSARGDRVLRAAGVVAGVMIVAGCVAAAVLEPRVADPNGAEAEWIAQLFVVGAAGMTVAWARPRNSIGWLLLVAVFLQMVSLLGATYAQASYSDGDPEPGAFLGAWLAAWAWFPSLALPVAVLPSLYPTGRPETRARRLLTWAGGLGILGMCLALGGSPDSPAEAVDGLRLAVPESPEWLDAAVLVATVLGLGVAVVVGLTAATARAFRAPSPERQQMLWLLLPLFPYVVGYFVTLPLWLPGYALVGVAVAIGVLRYGLLDIDVVVRRALFYLPLVALVTLVVALVSTAVARVAPDGPLPLLGSAVAVAVLVGPVTGWLRRRVDRFTLGLRADPVSAVRRVAALGEADSGKDPLATALAAMVEAVGVGYAAVLDPAGNRLAEVGRRPDGCLRHPLIEHGEDLGTLVVAVPADKAGRRMVDALVPHVASIVRNQMLAAEVDTERSRVAAAALIERERIRSDLHDGLGPSLSGISLGLQAASAAMTGEQPTARAILARTRAEADSAVGEVRRVLDALGPTALDERPLVLAIRGVAESLGFDGEGGPSFACASRVETALPAYVEETAFRIAGEALHNVARHANARHCAVSLSQQDATLELRVSDDGAGMGTQPLRGVGLESMRRRARAVGGSFAVTSGPGAGTVVSVRLPVAAS